MIMWCKGVLSFLIFLVGFLFFGIILEWIYVMILLWNFLFLFSNFSIFLYFNLIKIFSDILVKLDGLENKRYVCLMILWIKLFCGR